MWRSILTVLLSDAFKTGLMAFTIAFALSVVSKSSLSTKLSFNGWIQSATHFYKLLRGRATRIADKFRVQEAKGVPMTFDETDPETQGWGVCTLEGKKNIGRSRYVQYDFSLPREDNTLNLSLGQQLTLCCLDEKNNVSKGDFYLFSPRNAKGRFSILTPEVKNEDKSKELPINVELEIGKETGNFVSCVFSCRCMEPVPRPTSCSLIFLFRCGIIG